MVIQCCWDIGQCQNTCIFSAVEYISNIHSHSTIIPLFSHFCYHLWTGKVAHPSGRYFSVARQKIWGGLVVVC